jgi:Fic family protein
LNTGKTVHPVLESGIAQFQLVHVHPFVDGNGRTSRLLSTLCLLAGEDLDLETLLGRLGNVPRRTVPSRAQRQA